MLTERRQCSMFYESDIPHIRRARYARRFVAAAVALTLLVACSAPVETGGRHERTLATIESLEFTEPMPRNAGFVLTYLLGGRDTTLAQDLTELPATTVSTTFGTPTKTLFASAEDNRLRMSIVDTPARKQLGSIQLAYPIQAPDLADRSVQRSVTPVYSEVVVLDSLQMALMLAREDTAIRVGLLAIDLATFRPLWFLKRWDIVSIAAANTGSGHSIWISSRILSGFDVSGAVVRFDASRLLVSDSAALGGVTNSDGYAFSLLGLKDGPPTAFAVTATRVFRCASSPMQCLPLALPGTGKIVSSPKGTRLLQLVSAERVRPPGPAELRVLRSDGSIERVLDIPLARSSFNGGVYGAILADEQTAVLTFGANRLYAPAGQRGAVLLVDLTSGKQIWSGQLSSSALQPFNASSP